MSSPSYYVVIVGCGRLGGMLANDLSRAGHRLVVIDHRPQAFAKLDSVFSGFKIVGDAVELSVLHDAGLEKADYLLAVTEMDNVNLMIAQVAKKIFKVRHVVARVYDPAREEIFQKMGIDTVSPVRLAAVAILDKCRALGELM